MATGLSVDYAVYFAQKFMTVTGDGTGNCRMVVALGDTGYSVFLGGFTALCGERSNEAHGPGNAVANPDELACVLLACCCLCPHLSPGHSASTLHAVHAS
jgi:hypothetical protein